MQIINNIESKFEFDPLDFGNGGIKKFSKFILTINNIIHLSLKLKGYIGLQTWIDTREKNNKYCIEIYYIKSKPILLEYVNEDLWKDIINHINKI